MKRMLYLFFLICITSCIDSRNDTDNSLLDENKVIITPVKFIVKFRKKYEGDWTGAILPKLLLEVEFKNNTKDSVLILDGKSFDTRLEYISSESAYPLQTLGIKKESISINSLETKRVVFLLEYLQYSNINSAKKSNAILNDSVYEIKIDSSSLYETVFNKISHDSITVEYYFNDTLIDPSDKRYFLSIYNDSVPVSN